MGLFWTDEPTIIYKKYFEFIPTPNMSKEEQLNAITRLCIYYIIILLITQKSINLIKFPLIIIIILIIYNKFASNKEGLTDEAYQMEKKDKSKRVVESAYYDSDNSLEVNNFMKDKTKQLSFISDTINSFQEKCDLPTKDNPYQNPSVLDFESGNIPKPCNVDDDEINVKVKNCYDETLYRNLDDLFDKKNSERQFYTVPRENFTGNNADFAHFLYHDTGGCRGPDQKCNRYEDLRFSTLQH
jgi:hypothetical protein